MGVTLRTFKMELFKMMFFLTSLAFLANAISSPKGLFYQRRLQEQKALQEIYGRRRNDGTHSGYVRPIDTGYALAGYGFANSVFALLIRDNKKYEEERNLLKSIEIKSQKMRQMIVIQKLMMKKQKVDSLLFSISLYINFFSVYPLPFPLVL